MPVSNNLLPQGLIFFRKKEEGAFQAPPPGHLGLKLLLVPGKKHMGL